MKINENPLVDNITFSIIIIEVYQKREMIEFIINNTFLTNNLKNNNNNNHAIVYFKTLNRMIIINISNKIT